MALGTDPADTGDKCSDLSLADVIQHSDCNLFFGVGVAGWWLILHIVARKFILGSVVSELTKVDKISYL